MKRLKCFLAFSCIIAILVSFSGCSFRFSSFDNLLRPPKLSGEYQSLQDSFEKLVDKDYSLSTPENGLYRSAFIVNDFDMDKDEEAIVFYTEKKNPDLVKIYYFEYKNNAFVPVNSYDGLGSSVDEVKLADLNHDGKSEMMPLDKLDTEKLLAMGVSEKVIGDIQKSFDKSENEILHPDRQTLTGLKIGAKNMLDKIKAGGEKLKENIKSVGQER